MEIPLEEDYWPLIEKSLSEPPTSFYKYGWKHINIYNLSSALLILLLGSIYVFNTSKEQKSGEILVPASNNTIPQKTDGTSAETQINKSKTNTGSNHSKDKKTILTEPFPSKDKPLKDSSAIQMKDEVVNLVINPEPAKTIPVEKIKPKQIIYVVQQDTIIEKDTVKVRRKRKK